MAPSRRVRVLRCCSCRLFQAHQEKKSLKWICKACGEKQSFLRTYGEGSGAECRRHVQKLNLLQGQISEMSPRSLEEPENVDEEENAGPGQAERGSVQVGERGHLESSLMSRVQQLSQALCQCSRSPVVPQDVCLPSPPLHPAKCLSRYQGGCGS
ncbi:MRN complex-interacting protein isoform X9 [Halichoerus grypus]|uniref:MRN complex-interacting protein isoform X9 n=1 Tax=Halichoerus grypus TaxID=9711 RepID=UPI0016599A9A|nr:MRN complex-interacting protein isoform X9 [Halichoerus grypus]